MAALLCVASPAEGQEGAGAPADTAPAADTTEAAVDTARRASRSYPRLPAGVDSVPVGEVYRWDRDDLLDASALSVTDFLSDRLPGVLPLRANVHFGPHHLADGLLGPGAVRVVVDGRELPPLRSAQADLSRIALARVDRLVVIRRAGEVVVAVTTPSHSGGDAYSRITGGTGQPSADLIRGVFTNGAGRHFAVAGAVDHLNIGTGPGPGSRLDAWAKLSWMPFDDRSGVEILWHSDAVDRVASREEEFNRTELLVHGRADLARGLQVDLWAGRTRRDPGPVSRVAPRGSGEAVTEDDTVPPPLDVPQVELGVTAARGPVTVEGGARLHDAEGLANLEAELRAAVELTDGLTAHAAGELGSWEAFTTSVYSGGLALRPGVAGDLTLRAEASTGTRGLARPGRTADSVSFDALAGGAEVGLGPYRLSTRITRRTVDRRMPFGGPFDEALVPGEAAELVGVEGRAEGPLVPMDVLEDRLRIEGFWRRNSAPSGPLPLYAPRDLARGEFRFQDTYFGGNLGVRVMLRLLYRSAMLTARPGAGEPVMVPEESTFNSSVILRVDTFRVWWRVDNARRAEQRDFAGLPFPTARNVVGVSWEFFE